MRKLALFTGLFLAAVMTIPSQAAPPDDGDDRNASGPIPGVPLSGWGRVDVDTDDGEACATTDIFGTYWSEGGPPNGGIACAP